MKNILVPIEEHDRLEAVLCAARLYAALFGSRIEGVALGPELGDLLAADFIIAGAMFDEPTRREMVERARTVFERHMALHGVPPAQDAGSTRGASATYGWATSDIMTDSAVGAYARLADLVVVGRPGGGRGDPRRATLEAALFESGRPLLIAPHAPPAAVDGTIVVAWNRSAETARTVAFAMPLLRKARRVVVLSVKGALAPGPSGEGLATALRRHGLAAEFVQADGAGKPPGRTILEQAARYGADVLVKGGYTQGRLRQAIFGGPTSDILAHADLPVFMAH